MVGKRKEAMTTMRMKKFTIIGLSLCAMLMGQGSGGSEDTEAAESGQGAAQPALSVSRIPRGMVLIPGGTISGINPIDKGEKRFTDYPATYNITVDEFLMDINLVTKRLWDWVRDDPATVFRGYEMSAGGGKEANHPVQSVCWVDAVKWMNARSELMGREPVYYLDAEYTQIFRSGSGRRRPLSPGFRFFLPCVLCDFLRFFSLFIHFVELAFLSRAHPLPGGR